MAEPDCAVTAAVRAGTVDAERYDSYVRLLTELDEEPAH
jgi:putative ribosome biogenesis GTPase RsgA